MFKSESKSISTWAMRRELMEFNSWVAGRNPLMSETIGRKMLKIAREHKEVMWSDESSFTLFWSDGASLEKVQIKQYTLMPTV